MKTNKTIKVPAGGVTPVRTAITSPVEAASIPGKLQRHLNELGLLYMEEHAQSAAQDAAREGRSHLAYLEALAAGEANHQHDRAVTRRITAARFPVAKTMVGWNWSWPKKINRSQIEHLLELGFLEQSANVILLGSVGVGKTHLACALGHAACMQRYSVLYTSAIDVVNRLSAAQSSYQLASEIKRYEAPRLLILDELGYLPLDKRGGELLFQVISKRYERGSIIITTNRAYREWPSIFAGDATMTSALLDRLLHHAETIVIEGESYRGAKQK